MARLACQAASPDFYRRTHTMAGEGCCENISAPGVPTSTWRNDWFSWFARGGVGGLRASGRLRMTLPTAEARGFSALGRATCRVSAGTSGGRGSQILGGIQRCQEDRACSPWQRIACQNAANIR